MLCIDGNYNAGIVYASNGASTTSISAFPDNALSNINLAILADDYIEESPNYEYYDATFKERYIRTTTYDTICG